MRMKMPDTSENNEQIERAAKACKKVAEEANAPAQIWLAAAVRRRAATWSWA